MPENHQPPIIMDNNSKKSNQLLTKRKSKARVKFDQEEVVIESTQKLENTPTSSTAEPSEYSLTKLPFLAGKQNLKLPSTDDTVPLKNETYETMSPMKLIHILAQQASADLPQIVKSSLDAKMLDSTTLRLNQYLTTSDFFPLDQLLDKLKKFIDSRGEIREIHFDGLEVTTDLVLYILYKHLGNTDVLKNLQLVSLNGFRYVTDFGVKLLSYAAKKPSLVQWNLSIGCHKIVKLRHHGAWLGEEPNEEVIDLFGQSSFNKVCIFEYSN